MRAQAYIWLENFLLYEVRQPPTRGIEKEMIYSIGKSKNRSIIYYLREVFWCCVFDHLHRSVLDWKMNYMLWLICISLFVVSHHLLIDWIRSKDCRTSFVWFYSHFVIEVKEKRMKNNNIAVLSLGVIFFSLMIIEDVALKIHGFIFAILIHVIVGVLLFDLFPTGFFHMIN